MKNKKIAVIGLGYVGLPLAVEFGKIFEVIGFDIDSVRISELKELNDKTLEVSSKEIKHAKNLSFTLNPEEISNCSIYIVTVPTPIDRNKRPDLTPLIEASKTAGKVLNVGDIVKAKTAQVRTS